jgi:hypothetical protein
VTLRSEWPYCVVGALRSLTLICLASSRLTFRVRTEGSIERSSRQRVVLSMMTLFVRAREARMGEQ